MTNPSDTIFEYAGTRYFFQAKVYTSLTSGNIEVYCENDNIHTFMYSNEANNLVISGELIYTDNHGLFDKLVQQQLVYCDILFDEVDAKYASDGNTSNVLSKKRAFNHVFIVKGIEILKRDGTAITYKLNLVSANWFKCIAKIRYSNYGKAPSSILNILRDCLVLSDLRPDQDTFKTTTTDVTMNYITQRNDDMFSVMKFLMNRLYYSKTRDDSIKFVVYDEFTNKYGLFDFKNAGSSKGTYAIQLSFFGSKVEGLTQPSEVDFRSVTKLPSTDLTRELLDHRVIGFDRNNNVFENSDINANSIVSYMNNRLESGNSKPRFYKLFDTGLPMENVSTFWNNEIDIYNAATSTMINNNALVMKVSGDITRRPGSLVVLNLDRTLDSAEGNTTQDLKKLREQYRLFEGQYVVTRVRHVINMQQKAYTQNLVISRNFLNK